VLEILTDQWIEKKKSNTSHGNICWQPPLSPWVPGSGVVTTIWFVQLIEHGILDRYVSFFIRFL
jgi:hypothetical protein